MTTRAVYLDYNATTPVDPLVREMMLPYLQEEFGNPSSVYSLGFRAKKALTRAREQVAALLGANPTEITFTSGGSEANSTILMGIPLMQSRNGGHIITSSIEHPAILRACEFLQQYQDYDVTYLPVDERGVVRVEDVRDSIRPDTVLVTVMMVNNEVGSIQPIAEIGALCRRHGIHFHCDAVQAAGKLPIDVKALNADSLSVSAHKLYGPKGVGALYLCEGRSVLPLIHGGSQEAGLRSGTENVAGIAGFGLAAELAQQRLADLRDHVTDLRRLLLARLDETVGDWKLNGDQEGLPGTLNLCFPGLRAEALAAMLNQMGVQVSVASACSASSAKLSHVLTAMGRSEEEIRGSLRLSLGLPTTQEDILHATDVLAMLVGKLRMMSSKPVHSQRT